MSAFPATIAKEAAEIFGISRQAVQRYLNGLIEDRSLRAIGKTRGRRYLVRPIEAIAFNVVVRGLQEDVLWSKKIAPRLKNVPENLVRICAYGFTEMLNNVIDHSQSDSVFVRFVRTPTSIRFKIVDRGVGIFRKIASELSLEDERHAILELSKGKFTTDPERHSGEGVFFTSRLFDVYQIMSGRLFFIHKKSTDDWLLEMKDQHTKGTIIEMSISAKSQTTIDEVMARYAGVDHGFTKTHVPLSLAQYPNEQLVSRSQARRVLTRFFRFEEVYLDFHGVPYIGQAFADEIFRVYRKENRSTRVIAENANPQVQSMIDRASRAFVEEEADSAATRPAAGPRHVP